MRKDISQKRYEELKEKYGNEHVYVVPFPQTGIINDGFTAWNKKSPESVFCAVLPYGKFIERADAEGNAAFVQAIPYVLVSNTEGKYFVSHRIKGDKRLAGKLSLGFGGHVNPCDDTRGGVQKMMLNGLDRELNEELVLDKIPAKAIKIQEYGTVRDLKSTTPDHFGIVYNMVVDTAECGKLAIREKDILAGSWMTEQDLARNYHKFESWAQLILAHKLKDIAVEFSAA
jgi:predicted NUDIX family phosphoesterase